MLIGWIWADELTYLQIVTGGKNLSIILLLTHCGKINIIIEIIIGASNFE